MTRDGRRNRRGPTLPGLLAAAWILIPANAHAGEPLFLRIRPLPEAGSAEAAQTAREALWARSDARARAAIASVCTGCLGPPAVAPGARLARLAAPAGLEPDPVAVASDTATDPTIREERP